MRASREHLHVMRIWLCSLVVCVSALPLCAADPNKVDKSRFSYVARESPFDISLMKKEKYAYETPEQLQQAANSETPYIRSIALKMLAQRIGEGAKQILIKALDDPEVTMRYRAAELLAYLGDIRGLPRMQKDFDEWVQRYEKGICDGETIPGDPRVVWRRRSTPTEVLAIGQILARFGDNRAFGFAAKMALENPLQVWRRRAVEVLVEIAMNDRSALLAENRDPDPVFVVLAETESAKGVLDRVVLAALSMRTETQTKVLDAVIASQRAPEEVKAKARRALEREEKGRQLLEMQKRLKEQGKPVGTPEKPQ